MRPDDQHREWKNKARLHDIVENVVATSDLPKGALGRVVGVMGDVVLADFRERGSFRFKGGIPQKAQ